VESLLNHSQNEATQVSGNVVCRRNLRLSLVLQTSFWLVIASTCLIEFAVRQAKAGEGSAVQQQLDQELDTSADDTAGYADEDTGSNYIRPPSAQTTSGYSRLRQSRVTGVPNAAGPRNSINPARSQDSYRSQEAETSRSVHAPRFRNPVNRRSIDRDLDGEFEREDQSPDDARLGHERGENRPRKYNIRESNPGRDANPRSSFGNDSSDPDSDSNEPSRYPTSRSQRKLRDDTPFDRSSGDSDHTEFRNRNSDESADPKDELNDGLRDPKTDVDVDHDTPFKSSRELPRLGTFRQRSEPAARERTEPQSDQDSTPQEELTTVARPNRRLPRAPSGSEPASAESSSAAVGQPSLVADDGGPVAEILLHYSVTSEAELGKIFHDLFQHLSQTARVQVCCPNEQSAEAFASRWGTAAVGQGRSVHVINVNRPITVWARDRRICRQAPDGESASCFVPTAHATYDPEKQNDLVLPSLLWSTGLVPSVALTSMHLEGGNVVSNRRHVFVGANALEDNEHRFDSEESLFGELGRLFGRPTISIQGLDGGVPWIHTDMYLTPIDSKTILVASPVLGCELLPHRRTINAINRGKPVSVEFDAITPESLRQQRFDDVAKQLTDLGYQVIRMPALINVQKDWMVTYNNVIMDYQAGQRVVYMPIYNVPELDRTAAQTYEALGFEVKPIDVSAIFQLGGAIRCLANVTRRLPFEARLQNREPDGTGRLQVYSVDPSANRAREIRPRREQRPVASTFSDRRELPARDANDPQLSLFGQSSRRPGSVSQGTRNSRPRDDEDAPGAQIRPGFERSNLDRPNFDRANPDRPSRDRADSTVRQPVDAGF